MVRKKGLKLLMADDDEDDREFFANAVAEVDASVMVTFARDGEELMKLLKVNKSAHDLIFLDLNMPKKSGKECLAEIRTFEDLKKIPVIIYSTSISRQEADEAWKQGAYGCIRKPDSYGLLKEIVNTILDVDFNQLDLEARRKMVFNLRT